MNALVETRKFIFLGILAAIAFIGIYFATKQPEGKWICKTGTWIAEGKPTSPKPIGVCKP
ncbi:MAG: hypothetical protein WC720_05300 [Candidatus Shapirobacteria bacterium]|jgi:hypothetical protein